MGFSAGAVLASLDAALRDPGQGVPPGLLAGRLALRAAEATSALEGRRARAAEMRDALLLTPSGAANGPNAASGPSAAGGPSAVCGPNAACGPDGELYGFWRRGVRLRLKGPGWAVGLGELVEEATRGAVTGAQVEGWLAEAAEGATARGPLAASADALRAVLALDDRAERVACLLSDAVLARALGWERALPVTAAHLTRSALRDLAGGAGEGGCLGETVGATDGALAVQRAILRGAVDAVRLARETATRAAALRAVAPKLRAKGSDAAVALFLREEAVAPSSMLSPRIAGTAVAMTDRAARRLCDRLVALGAVRELTGRATFRLYGVLG